MEKKTETFKVKGLCKNSLRFDELVIMSKSGVPESIYNELAQRAENEKDFWNNDIQATVEYDDIGGDNAPINGVVTGVTINYKPCNY